MLQLPSFFAVLNNAPTAPRNSEQVIIVCGGEPLSADVLALISGTPTRAQTVRAYADVSVYLAETLAGSLNLAQMPEATGSVMNSAGQIIAAAEIYAEGQAAPAQLLSNAASQLRECSDRLVSDVARRVKEATDRSGLKPLVLVAGRLSMVSLACGQLERLLVDDVPTTRERANRRSEPALLHCAAAFLNQRDRGTAERCARFFSDESMLARSEGWLSVLRSWAQRSARQTQPGESGFINGIYSIEGAAFKIIEAAALPAPRF